MILAFTHTETSQAADVCKPCAARERTATNA